jgi:hypothetical protein
VTSPPVCITIDHKSLRFVADGKTRAGTADAAKVNVSVLYTDIRGRSRQMPLGLDKGTGAATPTRSFAIRTGMDGIAWTAAGTATVRFVVNSGNAFPVRIDDFYVDPMMR